MESSAKRVSASSWRWTTRPRPSDVKLYGTIFGGHLMSLMDKADGWVPGKKC
ncbi:MAG: hypothetical protein WCX13_04445 [Candidatus Hydrogenedentales bacterium]